MKESRIKSLNKSFEKNKIDEKNLEKTTGGLCSPFIPPVCPQLIGTKVPEICFYKVPGIC